MCAGVGGFNCNEGFNKRNDKALSLPKAAPLIKERDGFVRERALVYWFWESLDHALARGR